jgi:superoxide dismutase, Cu-Zn family
MMKKSIIASMIGTAAAGLGIMFGCSSDEPSTPTVVDPVTDSGTRPTDSGGGGPVDSGGGSTFVARAILGPTTDAGTVRGTATFTEANNEVTAVVTVTGSTAGLHGLHIHNGNNCNPTTNDAGVVTPGGGAGGHWNPLDAGHGDPASGGHHLGDMGNLTVDSTGMGTLTIKSKEWRVNGGGADSVVGHALVFHAGQDDLVSQPVGDAGARPGCGVIERQ